MKKPKLIIEWLFIYLKLKKITSKLKHDIIHVHSIGYYGILGLLMDCKNKIYTIWGSDLLINRNNFFKLILIKLMLNQAKLITTDAFHIKNLKNELDLKKSVEIINFGINTNLFSKIPSKIKSKNINIISLRSFYPIYNVSLLIKCVKKITTKYPNCAFYFAGTGSERENLENLVKKQGVEDKVSFLGYINNKNLPKILNEMDIYVSTSNSDAGIASSTAEAMSTEKICVITDVFENNKWIEHKKNGFLFKPNDLEDLYKQLCNAIEYKKLNKNNLQKKARDKIVKYNNYQVEMTKMEKLINMM